MKTRSAERANFAQLTGVEMRQLIRSGGYRGLTTGAARGYAQGNILIVPFAHAEEFAAFCRRNPKPCPLLAQSAPGVPEIPELGKDLDIRTDLPRYCVYRNGELVEEVDAIDSLWRGDFVTFVLGCWFTVEEALLAENIRLRHVELGIQGPMFETSVQTHRVGVFGGPMVMTMRPFASRDTERVVDITSRYPKAHGAPMHIGDPAVIGITDLQAPDFGEPMDVLPGEVSLYWACGVTSTTAMMKAQLPIAITHSPGCMLVTDINSTAMRA